MNRPKERRAVRAKVIKDSGFALVGRIRLGPDRHELRRVIREIERNASVAIAEGLDTNPDNFAGGSNRVEIPGIVAVESCWQNLGFENRGCQGCALQLVDHVEQCVGALPPTGDALPACFKPSKHCLIDRLGLLAKAREGAPPELPQYPGVGPLTRGAARTKLALDERSVRRQCQQRRLDGVRVDAESQRDLGRRERRVRSCVAANEIRERVDGRP